MPKPAPAAALDTILADTSWLRGVAGEAALPDGSTYRCNHVRPGLILVTEGRVAWTLDGRKMLVEAPALLLMPSSGREERRYLGPQRHLHLGLRQTAKAVTNAAFRRPHPTCWDNYLSVRHDMPSKSYSDGPTFLMPLLVIWIGAISPSSL